MAVVADAGYHVMSTSRGCTVEWTTGVARTGGFVLDDVLLARAAQPGGGGNRHEGHEIGGVADSGGGFGATGTRSGTKQIHSGLESEAAGVILRDAAGLAGLTALTATLLGRQLAWTLPVAWTGAASAGWCCTRPGVAASSGDGKAHETTSAICRQMAVSQKLRDHVMSTTHNRRDTPGVIREIG
jgi:hypothetical protein